MVRILHVFKYFNQGGIENFVMNVFRNIDRSKYQFDFAFISREEGFFDKEAEELGGHIYYFITNEKTVKNYYNSLSQIINEHGPYDVVHSHMYYFSGVILGIAKMRGVPIRIAHSHETLKGRAPTIRRKIYERIMRSTIKATANKLLACSDMAGKYVFGQDSKYTVLYNGIDLKRFTYKEEKRVTFRKKFGIEDKKVILNVGRFADQKNHSFIVDIFDSVCKKDDSFILMLIGTGPLKEETVSKLKAKGLFEKTIFLSNIQDTENYYNAADVFILPSKYEGMPIVSVEAQATGLYSLISNNITREIAVTDIIEYLDINDPEEWARRIIYSLSTQYDRSLYHRVFENTPFNIEQTVRDLSKIYLGV